jgi:hypothetical protein
MIAAGQARPYAGPGFRIVHSPKPPVPCAGVCQKLIQNPTPQQYKANSPSCGEKNCDLAIARAKFARLKAAGRIGRKKKARVAA